MEGSTAGEVSHYGTCRSGGIGLILRFVPLGKSPATSSSSISIAGVDEGKPLVHAVHLRLPTDCCALFCVPPTPPPPAAAAPAAAAAATAALPGSMQAPPERKPNWPLQHRPRDQQQQRRTAEAAATLPDEAQQDGGGAR
ncbi:hypothetical protein PF005_g29584 [Phytophthora fragariae]|uniref:Uncharacterized protein n=1 Tax=Phytophthora fragariae TaxID=53985 RepID=A0A6A3YAS6_9STRA|nr:hypothetical protein PF005_g29584 [Phytophthora fragariae]KAE9215390.1 hypothetical protein PF002_g17386 [Phytophthora fragariae]